MNSRLENRPDLAAAALWFRIACEASKQHAQLVRAAVLLYGNQGAAISGIVREHFPKRIKDTLRTLAREVTYASDKAHAMRPIRVRHATMRKLGREIAARYGSGFYGPV